MIKKILPVVLIVGVLFTGCGPGGPDSAASPKDGRVTLLWSDCAFGSCVYDWKACIGPDLLVNIDNTDHWVRNSEECV